MNEAAAYGVQQSRNASTITKVILRVRLLARSKFASPDRRNFGPLFDAYAESRYVPNLEEKNNIHTAWFL